MKTITPKSEETSWARFSEVFPDFEKHIDDGDISERKVFTISGLEGIRLPDGRLGVMDNDGTIELTQGSMCLESMCDKLTSHFNIQDD